MPQWNQRLRKVRRYYTQSEVANKLGLSEQIITRMCEQRKFNGAKSIEGKSGQWLIPKRKLRHYK
jgi:DNA-binding transcriptional regulator LsrR (DeoR family)